MHLSSKLERKPLQMAVCINITALILLWAPGNPSVFFLLTGNILKGDCGGTLWSTRLHVEHGMCSLVCSQWISAKCVLTAHLVNTMKKSLLERGICVLLVGDVLAEYKVSLKCISWRKTEGEEGMFVCRKHICKGSEAGQNLTLHRAWVRAVWRNKE